MAGTFPVLPGRRISTVARASSPSLFGLWPVVRTTGSKNGAAGVCGAFLSLFPGFSRVDPLSAAALGQVCIPSLFFPLSTHMSTDCSMGYPQLTSTRLCASPAPKGTPPPVSSFFFSQVLAAANCETSCRLKTALLHIPPELIL